jgi:hypothetical protein
VRFALRRAQFVLGLVQRLQARLEVADLALGGIERSRDRAALLLDLGAGHDERECRPVAPGHREETALDGHSLAARGRQRQRLRRARGCERGDAGSGEERVEAAGCSQRAKALMAAPLEEAAVGIEQCRVLVEQDTNRQAVEQHRLERRRRGLLHGLGIAAWRGIFLRCLREIR